MSVYVVDSNFFIEAHRMSYPMDVANSYWSKVSQLAIEGKIISIDKVKDEIYDRNDALEYWCKANLPEDFFKDSSDVMNEYSNVVSWAISRRDHYLAKALNEFLEADEADAFIIAYALAEPQNRIIVTQEISQPEMKKRIKIPEPCVALGVQFVNVMGMFRQLRETF